MEETNQHIYNSWMKPINIFIIHGRNKLLYLPFIEGTYLQFIEETNHPIYNSLKQTIVSTCKKLIYVS